MESTVPSGPIRKSRRLMGEQPEIIPDEFYIRESHPYVPSKSEKEKLMEEEGTIVIDVSAKGTEAEQIILQTKRR